MSLSKVKCLRIGLLALAFAGGAGLIVLATAAEEPEVKPRPLRTPEERAALHKARIAAAKKAYQGELETLAQSQRFAGVLHPDPENIYRWSVRWLRAERDLSSKHEDQIAALEAHFARMTKLQAIVKDLAKGVMPSFKAAEAEWYRLEAELWLAEANAAKE